MIDAKLILLDGITGAGKSTTAQRLWMHLERQGEAARWFYEHDVTHPVWQIAEQERLVAAGVVDPVVVTEVLPARWRDLARDCRRTGVITILESTFLQSTVGFLLAMNVSDEDILAYAVAADQAIGEAAPALIYFRPGDVAQALDAVFDDRRSVNYAADLIRHVAATPYGQTTGLSDVAGLVGFYEHWAALVDTLLPRLSLATLVIDKDADDWPARERRITDFLGLPEIGKFSAWIEQPSRFIGRYRDAASDDELVVAGDQQGLYLGDDRRTMLIPARDGAFQVAGTCAGLSFEDESRGAFQRVHLRGNLPALSPLWIRTEAIQNTDGAMVADDADTERSRPGMTG